MIARRSLLRTLVSLCVVVGGLLFVWSAPALAQRLHAFKEAFGSAGAGPGQLSRPGSLAVNDETGDVYVVDRGNGRVEIFSSTGTFVSEFNGSASPTGAFSWPEGEEHEGGIAIDNSAVPGDPSKGDVYVLDNDHNVIDKFNSNGSYIGEVVGKSPTSPFETVTGVAVDPGGALWVQLGWVVIDQFNDALANEYVSSLKPKIPNEEGGHTGTLSYKGMAFDSEDNLYIGVRPTIFEKFTFPIEFSKTGETLVEKLDDEETTGFAVDESSGDVYLDHETSVAAYSPSDPLIERFGSAQMQASEGIAVDSKTGTVYTANASSRQIDVFTAFVVPDATTGSASNFSETSVTVGGVVNPDGLPVTSCVFEYGTSESYGQTEPCSASPGSGNGPVAVSADLTGLERLTKYHFRLNVSNANGSHAGQDRTFVTPEPVALSEESVSDVSSVSALFSVQVNPGGADTTYHFEYGPGVPDGESVPVPDGDLGSGASSEAVSVRAEDLLAQTTYHVRVVAINVLGTVYGPDATFTTQAGGGAFVLPDGREWELVSPPNKEGTIILPIGGLPGIAVGHPSLIEASADGSAVSYYANAPLGTGPLSNSAPLGSTQVLSTRGGGGWSSEDIATPHKAAAEDLETEYLFFSPDLSRALVQPGGGMLLSPEATEATPYVRDDSTGSYAPLVTAGNVPPGTMFSPAGEPQYDLHAVAVTPDLSHVIVLSRFALTGNAINEPRGNNLFEWSGGQLQLVNILPDGTASAGEAQLGGGIGEGQNTRHGLSSNGSRVFFTLGGGAVYMRDTAVGRTVRVDAPAPGVSPPSVGASKARFEIASADGSRVFFLDEAPLTLDSKLKPVEFFSNPSDLYVCQMVEEAGEVKCDLTDLSVDANAGETANVQQEVVGASEDGSIVYFVATGKLAEGAESGKENLYVESETGTSWSPPRLVAVLSEADSYDWAGATTKNFSLGQMSRLTSRVSPSGRYLTFMSDQSLTGYDNRDVISARPDTEVFLYDESTGRVRCVSCNPTGARPDGIFDKGGEPVSERLLVDRKGLWGNGRWLAANIPGWTEPMEPLGYSASYQSRVLSDGGRMFFDSADALVPQDTNGREDVYEYEPVGVGGSSGCTATARTYVASEGGCVSLVSSGTSSEESAFLDASETGGDVFFLTTARLTRQDIDSSFDVYDAHVCSTSSPCVSVPVSPPPCSSGDSCKAAPSPQPAIFGAPSSATFSGAGNVTPSQQAGSTGTPKAGTKKKSSHGKRKSKRKSKSKGKSSRARRSLSVGTRR